jgi:hypothetical protein
MHMVRWVAILAVSFIAGCAARPAATSLPPAVDNYTIYDQATAASLVFDPPVASGQGALDLDREGRSPAAFVAYDRVSSTLFYLRFQDRQVLSSDGNSERRVVSETFGITSR